MRNVVHGLQARIRQLERRRIPCDEETVSSGFAALDRILPARGFRRGTLVEWLSAGPGCGEGILAVIGAEQACRDRGALVAVDRRGRFYPLPAIALGIQPSELLIVRPKNRREEAWAIDQALRSPAVGAVLAWPDKIDPHTFRRWQLAAETSGAVGSLVRPALARGDPSWADARLLVLPQAAGGMSAWQFRVEVPHCRGGGQGGAAEVAVSEMTGPVHETHLVPVAAKLAYPAKNGRSLLV